MYQEALADKGRGIFTQLKEFSDYYLAGGTALALQIGHRISVDFDLFGSDYISKSLLPKIKRVFNQSSISPSVNNPNELTVFINETKVSFVKYPFPVLLDFVKINGISALSIKEIAATKAYTIGRRGSFKDYVDLFFILKDNYSSLEEIMDLAEKKYSDEFNNRLFLEQLTYTKDVEDIEVILLNNEAVDKKFIFDFLYQKVGQIKI